MMSNYAKIAFKYVFISFDAITPHDRCSFVLKYEKPIRGEKMQNYSRLMRTRDKPLTENNQACYDELLVQFELIKTLCFEDSKNLVKIKSACHRCVTIIHYWKSGQKEQLRSIKLYTIELVEQTIQSCKNANNGKLMPIPEKVSLCKPALQGINFFMLQAPDCQANQICE